jgi:hypothetical protein
MRMTSLALLLSPDCPWWTLPVVLMGVGGLGLLVWRAAKAHRR